MATNRPASDAAWSDALDEEDIEVMQIDAKAPCDHPKADHIDGRGMVCVGCGEIVPVETTKGRPKRSRPIRSAANRQESA